MTDPIHHSHSLHLFDQDSKTGIYLNFSRLLSRNGFRQESQIEVIVFKKSGPDSIQKTLLRQTASFDEFQFDEKKGSITIRKAILGTEYSQGNFSANGHTCSWNLQIETRKLGSDERENSTLEQSSTSVLSSSQRVNVSGTFELDHEILELQEIQGLRIHRNQNHLSQDCHWAYGFNFLDEQGNKQEFEMEASSMRLQLGPVRGPKVSALRFYYEGQKYEFNSIRKAFQMRSHPSLTEWTFEASKGDLSFRGHIQSKNIDFVGTSYENTKGVVLYSAISKHSIAKVRIYRAGKLEKNLSSEGTSMEHVLSEKHPYIAVNS